MHSTIFHLPIPETKAFSRIVVDYVESNPQLAPFYEYAPTKEGLRQSLGNRNLYPVNRTLLQTELSNQYCQAQVFKAVAQNLQKLGHQNCFTITTAHQPNIATGPLYFFYKIAHAITLAKACKHWFPEHEFVPVFYMGSEDADLDELGHFTIQGKKYTWQTKQTGAVGRMLVDAELIALLKQAFGQLGVLPFGGKVQEVLTKCFTIGTKVQDATFLLVNEIFGEEGLLVLIPDNAALKTAFLPVAEKEIKEGYSQKLVVETSELLGKHYKSQAAGREINLFYLHENERERIERVGNHIVVQKLGLVFTEQDFLVHIQNHPETISPNVILRGVFQETILPNIAFIGGGGELAYWLQLKSVFQAVNVHFPVLILRNSWLQITQPQQEKLHKIGADFGQLFQGKLAFEKWYMTSHTKQLFNISETIAQMEQVYAKLNEQAASVDATLQPHVQALKTKALAKLYQVQKKMYRAEKRKEQEALIHIEKLLSELFPNNNLQERVESGLYWWAQYGGNFVQFLVENGQPIPSSFLLAVHPKHS